MTTVSKFFIISSTNSHNTISTAHIAHSELNKPNNLQNKQESLQAHLSAPEKADWGYRRPRSQKQDRYLEKYHKSKHSRLSAQQCQKPTWRRTSAIK